MTQLGAICDDAYLREDGGWKISTTRCTVTSSAMLSIAEGTPRVLQAGA